MSVNTNILFKIFRADLRVLSLCRETYLRQDLFFFNHPNIPLLFLMCCMKGYTHYVRLFLTDPRYHQILTVIGNSTKDEGNINIMNSALRWACCNGHFDIVKLMVENPRVRGLRKMKVNHYDDDDEMDYELINSVLMHGHYNSVELLIKKLEVSNIVRERLINWAYSNGDNQLLILLGMEPLDTEIEDFIVPLNDANESESIYSTANFVA